MRALGFLKRQTAGWRGVGRFWIGILALLGLCLLILQLMGAPAAPTAVAEHTPARAEAAKVTHPVRETAAASRLPEPAAGLPMVAIIVAGIGANQAVSSAAIKQLPPEIALALSPNIASPDKLAEADRDSGHEFLLPTPPTDQDQCPETHGSPVSAEKDAGARAYAMRFPAAEPGSKKDPHIDVIEVRIPSDGQAPVWRRAAAMVVDHDPVTDATIADRLLALADASLAKGSALGIVFIPRPVVIDRLAAWARTLSAKGIAITPISAFMRRQDTPDSGDMECSPP